MRILVLAILFATSLSGCVVVSQRPYYSEPVVVYRAPVVVQREVMFYPRYKEQRHHHHRHHDRRDRRW